MPLPNLFNSIHDYFVNISYRYLYNVYHREVPNNISNIQGILLIPIIICMIHNTGALYAYSLFTKHVSIVMSRQQQMAEGMLICWVSVS